MKNLHLLFLFAPLWVFSQSSFAEPDGTCWSDPPVVVQITVADSFFKSAKAGSSTGNVPFGDSTQKYMSCAPNPSQGQLKYYMGSFGPTPATGSTVHITNNLDAGVTIAFAGGGVDVAAIPYVDKTSNGSEVKVPPAGGSSGFMHSSYATTGAINITLTKDVLGGAVYIPPGIVLAESFRSVNKGVYATKPVLIVVTAGQLSPVSTTCSINNGNTISVPFGDISYDKLKTNGPSSTIKKDIALSYSCSNPLTQDISITLVATPASFNSNAIKSTTDNVGVVMMYDGKEVPPTTSFDTKIVNGVGNDTITFSPIISEGAPEVQGNFTASATLIMTSA